MKCDVCRKQLAETFLKKVVGTYVKDSEGKAHAVCAECQKRFKSKEELLASL